MSQLEGELSKSIKALRKELLDIASDIEASIDFPEEETGLLPSKDAAGKIESVLKNIEALAASADRGMVLTEGLRVVICGRPNVGKSSLMNALLRRKRVIVSHLPGTTRDAIEEMINIDGLPIKLIDTAGIIDSEDILTREGVKRSRFHIESSDLALFVLDGSEPLNGQDLRLIDTIKNKKAIVAINKSDMPKKIESGKIERALTGKKIIEVSVKERKNLKALEDAVSFMAWGGHVAADHTCLVTNARHKAALLHSAGTLRDALDVISSDGPPELLAIELREAIDALGEVTGETIDSEILNRIFDKFCIGK
jgi:tRNA modification GTPase